jgi:hypothetical protein
MNVEKITGIRRPLCPECGSPLCVDVGDLDDPKNVSYLFCHDCGYELKITPSFSENRKS